MSKIKAEIINMSGTPLTTLMCLNLLSTKTSLRQPPGKAEQVLEQPDHDRVQAAGHGLKPDRTTFKLPITEFLLVSRCSGDTSSCKNTLLV